MTATTDLLAHDLAGPAVFWRDRAYTAAEVVGAADDLARRLERAGVSVDTAVCAVIPSTPAGIVTWLGIWRSGAAALPVAPELAEDLDAVVRTAAPAAVVKPSNDPESLEPQVLACPGTARRYDADTAIVLRPSEVSIDAAVHVSDHQLLDLLDAAQERMPTSSAHVVALPLATWNGAVEALHALRRGVADVLLDPFDPAAFASTVRDFRIERAVLTPAMVAALLDAPSLSSLAPLRYVRCVTAPARSADARRLRDRFGVTVLNTYGAPELGGEVVGWTEADARAHADAKLGSAGRPHPGVTARVVADDGTDAAAGVAGVLLVRPGAAVTVRSTTTAAAAAWAGDGTLRTDATASIDADGFLWLEPQPIPA